jgi:hypothetical protein
MNRTRGVLVVLALLLLGILGSIGSFTGGFGFFHTQSYTAEVTLPTPNLPDAPPSEPVELVTKKPCNGQPGPIKYYGNDPAAAEHNNFGTPLDPRLSPLYEPYNPKPDVRQIVDATWERLCRDPVLTRAVVAAAYPEWTGLHHRFDWMAALNLLFMLDWGNATLEYYSTPPSPWTMMMLHGKDASNPPTVHITRAHYAGWYLRIPAEGQDLVLRVGCGAQPSVDLHEGTRQATLTRIFPVS